MRCCHSDYDPAVLANCSRTVEANARLFRPSPDHLPLPACPSPHHLPLPGHCSAPSALPSQPTTPATVPVTTTSSPAKQHVTAFLDAAQHICMPAPSDHSATDSSAPVTTTGPAAGQHHLPSSRTPESPRPATRSAALLVTAAGLAVSGVPISIRLLDWLHDWPPTILPADSTVTAASSANGSHPREMGSASPPTSPPSWSEDQTKRGDTGRDATTGAAGAGAADAAGGGGDNRQRQSDCQPGIDSAPPPPSPFSWSVGDVERADSASLLLAADCVYDEVLTSALFRTLHALLAGRTERVRAPGYPYAASGDR